MKKTLSLILVSVVSLLAAPVRADVSSTPDSHRVWGTLGFPLDQLRNPIPPEARRRTSAPLPIAGRATAMKFGVRLLPLQPEADPSFPMPFQELLTPAEVGITPREFEDLSAEILGEPLETLADLWQSSDDDYYLLLRKKRRGGGAASTPALALGSHSSTDNGATSSATVEVSFTPQAAGSVIACGFAFSNSATFTSIADNVNSGSYLPAASNMREANHNFKDGIYYHENVAASATTITLTYSPAETHGRMACLEVKNTPASYALDSNYISGQATTATNPTTGTTLTPTNNGDFLYAGLSESGGTVTAGTNYTLLDALTGTAADKWVPEYRIQTTATSSNGPYSDSTSAAYGDQTIAFSPQLGGTCGLSTLFDWGGGTNGSTVALADLANDIHGGHAQPNADSAYEGNDSSHRTPGWFASGTPNMTYSSAAYAPLQTTRTCPFYSGSGTTGAAVGLSESTTTIPNATWNYIFDTTSQIVTCWVCLMSTVPTTTSATADQVNIGRLDNNDFDLLQWNTNGTTTSWDLESKGGTCSSLTSAACNGNTTFGWTSSTWYGFFFTYMGNVGGTHSISVYSFSSAQCQGAKTLLGTMTGSSAAAGPPNVLTIGLGGNNSTYPAGHTFNLGAVELDMLYGATLNP